VVMKGGQVRADDTPGALMASADPDVRALMDMPRRQALRVRDLLNGGDRHG
jgi:osmoprotectant transport system ATP-binding protein